MRLPAVLLLGVLVVADLVAAGVTWLVSELSGRDGAAAALAVLLVASPLGFLVARYAPLPVSRRLGRRDGITHLGSAADRALARLRVLVIEVDHVVTTGNLVVIDVVPVEARYLRDLRWFAGALAHSSTDRVARAVARLAGRGKTTDVIEGPTHDLRGSVDRHPVHFGVDGMGDVAPIVGTTVHVEVDLRPMGHITVAEEVRANAARCLSTLRAAGIEPVLASASLGKPDLLRVSEQVDVPQFHPDSDASTVLASLPSATTGTARAVAATSNPTEVVGELVLPSQDGEDTVIRCADPSVETVLGALEHLRSLRRARRLSLVCAAAAVAVTVPLAALGVLSPAAAALTALASALLLAVVASMAVLTYAPAPD